MESPIVKEPWELFPEIWKTQAAFFTYLRGSIRQIWSRYPPKLAWKKAQMQPPPPGYKGRAKSLGSCYYCNQTFSASSLEVDHVDQAGTCNSWETAAQFLKNLLDCNGNWVLACKPCHKIKSYAERTGLSFSEATAEKKAIEFMKKSKAVVLAKCKKHGYTDGELTNDDKRRKALSEIFKKEIQDD